MACAGAEPRHQVVCKNISERGQGFGFDEHGLNWGAGARSWGPWRIGKCCPAPLQHPGPALIFFRKLAKQSFGGSQASCPGFFTSFSLLYIFRQDLTKMWTRQPSKFSFHSLQVAGVTCHQYLTICVYVCTSMCVDAHISECRCPERLEAGDPPEFGGTVTHELLDVGAGNQIQDLWKSSKRS